MIARVEVGPDVPAEVIRLLPLVGLEVVRGADAASLRTSTGGHSPKLAEQRAMQGEFGAHRVIMLDSPDKFIRADKVNWADKLKALDPPSGPLALRIAFDPLASGRNSSADFVTDSAVAAVCFILSRALGLAAPFLTVDAKLFEVICAAVAVARGPARVLVEGEIGVGKESLVKLMYAVSRDPARLADSGGSPRGPAGSHDIGGLVHAECAGLEADAVEAEIGPLLAQAMSTDSECAYRGGGAIFFNRIGELSLAAQRKLLDLLHAFSAAPPDRRDLLDLPKRNMIASPRIFAASTQPLAAMVDRGQLLPELNDLFDVTLTILPLRTRRGDLPLLVRHYLRGLNPALTLNAAALRALSVYPFPGNVLELISFVTRVAIAPPKSAVGRPGAGNAASGHPDLNVVGRAEVIAQLDRASLNEVWRSRQHWNSGLKRSRKKLLVPILEPDVDEWAPAGGALLTVPALAPVSLRLTPIPRLRKPRIGNHRPPV